MKKFRAPAVPLVTHDPLFSVWSFADNLTDDVPRHWDGQRQYMFGLVVVDNVIYEFMGKSYADDARYSTGYRKLPQTGCEIRPMTTKYTFENDLLAMELTFTSPLLLNDLMVLSRPVTYVDYKITTKDGAEHVVHVHFGFSGELCVNEITQKVAPILTPYSIGFTSGTENMLVRAGDDHRMEWGTFHVVAPDYIQECTSLRNYHMGLLAKYPGLRFPVNPMCPQGPRRECAGPKTYEVNEYTTVAPYWPTILIRKEWTTAETISDRIALAYDDVKSLQYFGENIDAYWKKDGDSFTQMIRKAINEHDRILEKVKAFEDDLLARARTISDKYADILSLAYRQVIAGHKLTWHDGELQFISKENNSNGSAGTVDVTYPSIPLFLIYAPELVEGMLNPIFKMIEQGLWDFEFAPHDIGTYPLCNGQTYGYTFRHRLMRHPIESQMPVEECGNMLLCVAATCFAKKDMAYFVKHQQILKQWADYLVKIGYNPDNQLCTDDFAGHLAHNVNLSAKAICALGAYAKMLKSVGDETGAAYYEAEAKKMVAQWEAEAEDEECYKLTFDREGTWSLKYNVVWDKLLDLKLFSRKVYTKELACYKKRVARYGIPMDCRSDYTKTDWELWSTALFDDKEYTDMVVNAMWDFLNETPDRVPFTDWHFTSEAWERSFQARTVQGGLFINLLKF